MNKTVNKKKISKQGMSDAAFNTFLVVLVTIILLIELYPMIFVVSSSFSSGNAVSSGRVLLWPVEFSVKGYEMVFKNQMIWGGYANTFVYVVGGTITNLFFTVCGAYPLSRRGYCIKGFIVKFLTISMFFGGGLIATYIWVNDLGLVNTRTWMIISGAVSISHIILMRTFFQTGVPEELLESAKMDGISDIGYLFKIVLPLSKAVISVITLYCIVGKWNEFFGPMLYLRDREKYPLILITNEILVGAKFNTAEFTDQNLIEQMAAIVDTMKYALIMVSTVPMLILYPFVQKFFEKGVMVGSIKG